MSNAAPTEPDAQPTVDSELTSDDSATKIDWAALRDKLGFDSPDAAGNKLALDTQLVGALDLTDKSPASDAIDQLKQAVASGILVTCTADGGTLRGSAFIGGDR